MIQSVKQQMPQTTNAFTPNIIYDVQIIYNTNDVHKKYLGAAEISFKERYNNQAQDFKHKKYMKCTKLSKYIQNTKNQRITSIVKWRIGKKVNIEVSPSYYKLCLTENFAIIKSHANCNLLNKYELVSKCRYQNKLLLCNVKRNDSMD